MIIQERNSKNLIIPKSLGNFATNGGGTGGVTPEEAAEIASAVTEAAIDAYDADLQTNLDGIRSAVSGNTDDIAALSGDLSALSASTESGLQSANAAASAANTLAGSAYTRADAAYALAQEAKPFGIQITSTDSEEWTQEDIEALTAMRQHLLFQPYDAVQGSYISVGGIYAGRIYTLEHFFTENGDAVFSANEGEWNRFFYLNLEDVMESYHAEHNSAASYEMTEVRGDLETLSASTETALAGKQDTLTAGSGISIQNNVISCTVSGGTDESIKTIYVDLSDGSTGAQVYAKIDSAYTAGKEVILRAIDSSYRRNGAQVLLPFSRKNGSDYYFQGTWAQETSANLQEYLVKIKSNGTTEGTETYDNIIYAYRKSLLQNYSLPTAAANTKGGVKVGSGLTMNGETMSVAIGDGLAYSGNSIVVSGGTGGGAEPVIINDILSGTQAEIQAFYNEMKPLISGSTSQGWDFNLFWRLEFYDNTYNLAPVSSAWINKEDAFGNENITFVFEYTGYATDYSNSATPDRVKVEISSDGTYSMEGPYGGRGIPQAYDPFIVAAYDNDMCLTGISHETKALMWESYKSEGKEGYARKTIIAYVHTGDVMPTRFNLIYTEGDFSEDEGNASLYFGAIYNTVSDSSLHSARFRLKKDTVNDVYTIDNIVEYSYSRTS